MVPNSLTDPIITKTSHSYWSTVGLDTYSLHLWSPDPFPIPHDTLHPSMLQAFWAQVAWAWSMALLTKARRKESVKFWTIIDECQSMFCGMGQWVKSVEGQCKGCYCRVSCQCSCHYSWLRLHENTQIFSAWFVFQPLGIIIGNSSSYSPIDIWVVMELRMASIRSIALCSSFQLLWSFSRWRSDMVD
jgi:hypothetical protein